MPPDTQNNPVQPPPQNNVPQPPQVPQPNNWQQPTPNNVPPTPVQPPAKTSGLAIAGFILAFIAPLIGLILSIVALSQIKHKQEKGRGLAIAGIVISLVWGFLVAGLVLALTFATIGGVQQKARDTERSTDINSLSSQLEAYNAVSGYYPTLSQLNDSNWRLQNMPSLDNEALRDPQSSSYTLVASPASDVYAYAVTPSGCDNVKVNCTHYTLTATYETGSPYAVSSPGN